MEAGGRRSGGATVRPWDVRRCSSRPVRRPLAGRPSGSPSPVPGPRRHRHDHGSRSRARCPSCCRRCSPPSTSPPAPRRHRHRRHRRRRVPPRQARLAVASSPPAGIIGVAPDGLVAADDAPSTADQVDVDPGLTALVRVKGDQWGDETPMLSRVVTEVAVPGSSRRAARRRRRRHRLEVTEHLRQRRPIVVLGGSGRLADEVADGDGRPRRRGARRAARRRRRAGRAAVRRPGGAARRAAGHPRSAQATHGSSVGSGAAAGRSCSPCSRGCRSALRRRRRCSRRRLAASTRSWPTASTRPTASSSRRSSRATSWRCASRTAGAGSPCWRSPEASSPRVFGAVQAWLQSALWPGVLVVSLGAASSALTTVARRQGALQVVPVGAVAGRAAALALLRARRAWPPVRRTTPPAPT